MNEFEIFMNFRRLRHIKRCNNFPTNKPIDVAEHSYYVSLLALTLANDWNNYHEDEQVDTGEVVKKALLHDLGEAFTGDIAWNIKHATLEVHNEISKAMGTLMEKIYKDSPLKYLNDLSATSKNGKAGEFVALADMLELALYCYEESMMGNEFIFPLLSKAIGIVETNPLYEELLLVSPLFKDMVYAISSGNERIAATCINVD